MAVLDNGRPLPVGGPKQRALLAMLLLEANRPVPKERLIDGIWGERPPASDSDALDTYVYRLRKVLGSDRLVRLQPGYVLRVETGELDLSVFDELVRSTEQLLPQDPGTAARTLEQALDLWHGRALADVRYEPFAGDIADQLEERRLTAEERRAEAALATGLGSELVPVLERLAQAHPTRERVVAHLIVALYRAGRQSDALEAMQRCRRQLAVELGLEPGLQLRQLEQLVLNHDETLGPTPPLAVTGLPSPSPIQASPGASVAAPPGPDSSGRLRSKPVKLAVLAAVAGALTVAATVVATVGPKTAPAVAVNVNVLEAIGARSGHAGDRVVLPAQPGAVAVARGSVWVASPNGTAVFQVGPAQAAVIDRIPLGGEPGSIVSGGGAVFVASTVGGTVERIDPESGTVTWTSQLAETGPVAMAYADGSLWVADSTDQDLLELGAAVRVGPAHLLPRCAPDFDSAG